MPRRCCVEGDQEGGRYLIAHSHNIDDRGGVIKKATLRGIHALIRRHPNHFFACSDEAARFAFGGTIADSCDCEIFYNGIDVEQYRIDEKGSSRIARTVISRC